MDRHEILGIINDLEGWGRLGATMGPNMLLDYAKRIRNAIGPLLGIDLSKISPMPWQAVAGNWPIADTGDYSGFCEVRDANGKTILAGDGDSPDCRTVEQDGTDYDANCVAAVACVNMVAELQKAFGAYNNQNETDKPEDGHGQETPEN